MLLRKLLIMTVATPIMLLSDSAVGNSAGIAVLDRLFDAIKAGILPPTDVRILEHAAEGRFEESDVAVVLSLGISRNDFVPLSFRSFDTRVHAFRKIGEIGLPEALRYLSSVTLADIGNDTTQQIWPAARIALHVAQLNHVEGQDGKIAFLRQSLTERNPGFADGQVQNWALEELCNRGDQGSLPAIRERFKRAYAGSPGEQERVKYCEDRMRIVSRSLDRVQALASALQLHDEPVDIRLISWAVSQLAELQSSAANRELARFGAEIAALQQGSPVRQRFLGIEDRIKNALAQPVP